MAVRIETINDLLEQKEWETCVKLINRALAESEWPQADRAFLNFALCKSLSNRYRYSAAVEPGQLAVFLAEETKNYDLMGRSLMELAYVQNKVQGMERWAPETQRRFLTNFEHYKTIRDMYLPAMFNLGAYLRTAGLYAEALEQFKVTYIEARKRGNHDLAHLARSSAVWEALRLERVEDADDLIKQGESYQSEEPRMRASHQLDIAQLALLKGNTQVAAEQAALAAVQCSEIPDLFARAMEIIQSAADREGDGELAIVAGIIAKQQAEADDRHDIMAQVASSVRSLALRYPEAVKRLMSTLDGPK